jgi:hypothetical protein
MSTKKPTRRPPPAPEPRAGRSRLPVVIGGTVVLLASFAIFVLSRSDTPPAPAPAPQATVEPPAQSPAPTPPAPVEIPTEPPPRAAPAGPLPPLPMEPSPRSPEMVRLAYEFAARHPEVLHYVPCFCGCENRGHRGNDDCFIQARDAEGRVTWDPHGMT